MSNLDTVALGIESSLSNMNKHLSVMDIVELMHKRTGSFDRQYLHTTLDALGFTTNYTIPIYHSYAMTAAQVAAASMATSGTMPTMQLLDACEYIYNSKYRSVGSPTMQQHIMHPAYKLGQIFKENGSFIVKVAEEYLEFETVAGLERFVKDDKIKPTWIGDDDDKPTVSFDWVDEEEAEFGITAGNLYFNASGQVISSSSFLASNGNGSSGATWVSINSPQCTHCGR